jgi:hypothetical protein
MAISVGDVFNYPGTDSGESVLSQYKHKSWHIHIVVKLDEIRGDAYLVPLSTNSYDRTCEIKVNDRCPLVTKPCVVAYFHGKKIPLDTLQKIGVASGPAPKELLARVIAGVGASSRSEQWFKDAVSPPPPRGGRILAG